MNTLKGVFNAFVTSVSRQNRGITIQIFTEHLNLILLLWKLAFVRLVM